MERLSEPSHYSYLAILLSYRDVRDTYKRSKLGPLWVVIALAVQVGVISGIFSLLLRQDLYVFLPHVAVGFVLWQLITQSLNESAVAFPQSEAILKQIYIPAFVPILRVFSKHMILFAHNILVVILAFLATGRDLSFTAFFAIPGFFLVAMNIFWVAVFVGIGGARFRDLPPIVAAFFTIGFYFTPIIWTLNQLPMKFQELIIFGNPFFHIIEVVRAPLLGEAPMAVTWVLLLVLGLGGNLAAYLLGRKLSWRINYWL